MKTRSTSVIEIFLALSYSHPVITRKGYFLRLREYKTRRPLRSSRCALLLSQKVAALHGVIEFVVIGVAGNEIDG